MKKLLLIILTTILASSCQSIAQKEMEKSAKAKSGSSRINSAAQNSKDNLKELDE